MSDENVVDFATAKQDLAPVRKEKAAQKMRKKFQQAMGWKSLPKTKPKTSKGPKPKRGKKR